jgi:hypothetical protein
MNLTQIIQNNYFKPKQVVRLLKNFDILWIEEKKCGHVTKLK